MPQLICKFCNEPFFAENPLEHINRLSFDKFWISKFGFQKFGISIVQSLTPKEIVKHVPLKKQQHNLLEL